MFELTLMSIILLAVSLIAYHESQTIDTTRPIHDKHIRRAISEDLDNILTKITTDIAVKGWTHSLVYFDLCFDSVSPAHFAILLSEALPDCYSVEGKVEDYGYLMKVSLRETGVQNG